MSTETKQQHTPQAQRMIDAREARIHAQNDSLVALQAKVRTLEADQAHRINSYAELRAENERLRIALKSLIAVDEANFPDMLPGSHHGATLEQARAALAGAAP